MELGDNLQQLERKVKETVDWRTQFEQKPMLGLGMAFGAGLLLSALMPSGDDKGEAKQSSNANYAYTPYASYTAESSGDGQRREPRPQSGYMASSQPTRQRSPEMNEISETLENIKGALLGLGATRLRSFLAEAVPGFHQEYEQARRSRNNSPQTRLETAESTISDDARQRAASYDMSNSAPSGGMRETQSTYHPDLNTQTPGMDQRARDAAIRPSADAFGSSQTTSNPPR
jgi:hypothetical protein